MRVIYFRRAWAGHTCWKTFCSWSTGRIWFWHSLEDLSTIWNSRSFGFPQLSLSLPGIYKSSLPCASLIRILYSALRKTCWPFDYFFQLTLLNRPANRKAFPNINTFLHVFIPSTSQPALLLAILTKDLKLSFRPTRLKSCRSEECHRRCRNK